jgi:hypothetical protein
MRVCGYLHTPAALTLGNRSDVHFIEDRVRCSFSVNGRGKPGNPGNLSPVVRNGVSRCTTTLCQPPPPLNAEVKNA